ncbi:class I SAM-dependent methyltransferase [Methylocapsa acidiphila]|uniref:class I SAM-dependent methyltransferase n=1 Tax=Methylocapsa acidiphila TaxID=133552 RepID=UPI000402CA76|nr:class I SAM-dependent methyltransferase [Methylocapsa acidiphila]
MSDWSAGYVTEVGYAHGYYRELAPQNLALAASAKGVLAPGLDGAPLRVLELGCGQGYSANLIAAANPHVDYTAIDFNPGHVASARALAEEARTSNVHFSEASFAEFAEDCGRGEFDLVTLHGVWTWVSAENRAQIIRIAREKLRPGGLFYLSYNCHPGWAASVPIHRLFTDVAAGAPQEPVDFRIDQFFKVFKLLRDIGARGLEANPGVVERFLQMEDLPRNCLAHEFLNANWTIFHSADVARDLAEAKLNFVASAHIADQLDPLNLTDRQQHLLNQVRDPVRKELFRDLITNQSFRRDIFIKGDVRPCPRSEERWLDLRFALTARAADIPLQVKGMLAEAALTPETYGVLLERLDRGPETVRELIAEPKLQALGLANLRQHLLVLVAQKNCQIALPAGDEETRKSRTDAFNHAVMARARDGSDYGFLASPTTGGGIAVDRIGQLALTALRDGSPDPFGFVWNVLKDEASSRPEGPAGTLEASKGKLANFMTKTLPVLQKLKVS